MRPSMRRDLAQDATSAVPGSNKPRGISMRQQCPCKPSRARLIAGRSNVAQMLCELLAQPVIPDHQ